MKCLKKIKYCSLIVISFLIGFIFSGCNKDLPVYGDGIVYMPQATSSGGLDNTYLVPSGGGKYTYNFLVNNGKVNIILGVKRSGTFVGENFTVNINVDKEEANQVITSGNIPNAEVLSAEDYTLPSKVTVNSSNEASFFLTVDSAYLIGNYSHTGGKKLVLAVDINSPSAYKLSDKYNKTIIIIDVDALRDLLNPIQPYSTAMWKVVKYSSAEHAGEDGKVENMFDNNPDTFWQTEWFNASPGPPHWFIIDMGKEHVLHGMMFLDRKGGFAGNPKEVHVYVSNDNVTWTEVAQLNPALDDGNNPEWQTFTFDKPTQSVKFFKVVVTSMYNTPTYGCLAGLKVF